MYRIYDRLHTPFAYKAKNDLVDPLTTCKPAGPPLHEELLMAFFLSIYLVGILGFLLHVWWTGAWDRKFELALLYQLVFSLGVTSLVAFYGLTFMDKEIAAFTGWPSCPFEQQLANVNLGYGVLGILCIWFRGHFWTATILGFSIWIIGDGIQHLYHYLVHQNSAPGNVGVPLWTDFLVPITLLILLGLVKKRTF